MKSKIILSLLVIGLLFLGTDIRSQNTIISEDPYSVSMDDTFDGTWQIQVVNSRNQPYIPGNIDEIVRENRKQSEVVYIRLDDNVRIKILSQDEISASGFKPLEKVIHIEE